MEMPNVCNVFRDEAKNTTYKVYAYRTLSREELVFAVRSFIGSMKGKPKKNTVYDIISIIGARD